MARNTSITLGEHFTNFVKNQVEKGRCESTSEAVRAALRLLEERETKLENFRQILSSGESKLDRGEGIDGEAFMSELLN